jgi:hypothetical protein
MERNLGYLTPVGQLRPVHLSPVSINTNLPTGVNLVPRGRPWIVLFNNRCLAFFFVLLWLQDPAYQEYYEQYYAELEKSSQALPNKQQQQQHRQQSDPSKTPAKTGQEQKVRRMFIYFFKVFVQVLIL